MNDNLEKLGGRLRAAYGTAPESYRDDMRRTLSQIEEEQTVKKYSIRTIILTIVLLLALAGAALAITRQLGVLDFLSASRELTEEVAGAVQTELSQEGGDLPGATVRIRDAVSDGRTLFLAVEVRPKDPQAAILAMTDAINWKDPEEREAFMVSRAPETQPLYDQIADGCMSVRTWA